MADGTSSQSAALQPDVARYRAREGDKAGKELIFPIADEPGEVTRPRRDDERHRYLDRKRDDQGDGSLGKRPLPDGSLEVQARVGILGP